jgi:hypothetical protein
MIRPRSGFSLVEVLVVSGLMVALALLLSSLWRSLGRPAVDLIGRSQLVQERDLAVVALCRDLGGSVGDPDRRGCSEKGQWLAWEAPTSTEYPQDSDLRLLYDGRIDPSTSVSYAWTSPPNTIIRYLLAADPDPAITTKLLVRRRNEDSATDFTVARNLDSMKVTAIDGRPDAFSVVLCFKYRNLTLTCDFTVEKP